MALGDIITVINRTSDPLEVMMNGHIRTFQPGKNKEIPWEWLYYCKNQHPLMGSEDPYGAPGHSAEWLLIREGSKDNASKLTAKDLGQVERLDRSLLPDADVVAGRREGGSSGSRGTPPVMMGTGA